MAVLLALVSSLMILFGGVVAARAHDHRHLVLGLAGGIVLGVVSFDLLPESLAESGGELLHVPLPMVGFAIGFALLHVVEQATAMHAAHEHEYAPHDHPGGEASGRIAALAVITHTFLDGLSIGLALEAPGATGLLVALAVFAHNFADGFNTVTFAAFRDRDKRPARPFLAAAMLAPVAGAALTQVVDIPHAVLGPYLGFISGVLLYLAAADILPEAHANHPRVATLLMTGLGVAGILLIVGTASSGGGHAH
ncbi:ZIP family metal transporter [Actinomadura parmotrematis]|uniref:ZIP family metal transporter n=1 Tax=Actinomadura parmotrematis TaxID=2864039 RepID=A0ABS7FTT0_9ACTN|nr:ZIP family metal transporter [Actinomadura parmotrematis]MBW8483812.1 ZIP family metal transporter [Actinomadura parmotrematis]